MRAASRKAGAHFLVRKISGRLPSPVSPGAAKLANGSGDLIWSLKRNIPPSDFRRFSKIKPRRTDLSARAS